MIRRLLRGLGVDRPMSLEAAGARLEGLGSPLIVMGCHRAGTTLLTQLLERCFGVSFGRDLDENNESRLFIELNQWLLQLAGGNWDHARPTAYLAEHAPLQEAILTHLRATVAVRSHDMVAGGNGPWGWKDPRNTFTLPLWLDVFPNARLVSVSRHGVDVAASLQVRELARMQKLERALVEYRGRRAGRRLRSRLPYPLLYSPRCCTLRGAFELWEEYATAVEEAASRHPVLDVRYEDLVRDPEAVALELASHLRLPQTQIAVQELTSFCDASRALAYTGDPKLRAFAAANAEKLEAHGYRAVPGL